MRMLAIFLFALILIPFGVSGFEGYSGGRWLLYLLLLAGPSFFWQQDVRTARISFGRPAGKITVTFTPHWTTFIPGAAYSIKSTIVLPMPSEDPKVVSKPRNYHDQLSRGLQETWPLSTFSVSVPTVGGRSFRLYHGRSRAAAHDIVTHIRWARQDLIRGRSMPANQSAEPARG